MLAIDDSSRVTDRNSAAMNSRFKPRPQKRFRWAALAMLAACLHVTPVVAVDVLNDAAAKKLLNARSCNACHGIDEVRLGPSCKSVALRYADAPASSFDWLVQKIIV